MGKFIEKTEEYAEYFLVDENIDSDGGKFDRGNLEEALKVALETRRFEIDLYWRRSNYFILFIGAVFVAYFQADAFFLKFFLIVMGYISSFVWFCVNRGSKFWQENWEENIKRDGEIMYYNY